MATYNEEVTTREKYKTWMVTKPNGLARVEYTDKAMTPSQALKHFKDASGVMGLNGDRNIK